MMDSLLEEKEEFSALYIDDVIIFFNSWEEHIVHIHLVLQCTRNTGFPGEKIHVVTRYNA